MKQWYDGYTFKGVGSVYNPNSVMKALYNGDFDSYWTQMSKTIQNACEPLGSTKIEYSPTTKMYTATAKVGVRGDRYQKMLDSASSYKPDNLSGKDLESFMEANKSIMNAAKGN